MTRRLNVAVTTLIVMTLSGCATRQTAEIADGDVFEENLIALENLAATVRRYDPPAAASTTDQPVTVK